MCCGLITSCCVLFTTSGTPLARSSSACGCVGNILTSQSLAGAFMRGYKTVVVEDCCGDRTVEKHDNTMGIYGQVQDWWSLVPGALLWHPNPLLLVLNSTCSLAPPWTPCWLHATGFLLCSYLLPSLACAGRPILQEQGVFSYKGTSAFWCLISCWLRLS